MKQQLPYKRTDRVSHQIQGILGEITTRHINLSHLGFITFSRVTITPDLKIASVYYTVMKPKQDIKLIEREMKSKISLFRKYLGQALHIKFTPEIRFYFDDSVNYSHRIEEVLSKIDIPIETNDSEYL